MKDKYGSLTIVFYILFIKLILSQQPEYFNYRYDISQTGALDKSFCIIETDNQYVLAGYSQNSALTNWNMTLSCYNEQGALQWIKSFGDTISNYTLGDPGCLIQFEEGRYYSVGLKRTFTDFWVHDRLMLCCYNENFDTVWTKYYGEEAEPYDTAYLFHQLKKTSDNQLILAGEWMPYGEAIRMCLIKTDTSGNLQWKQSYGTGSGYFRGYSVIETSDNGYVIGGYLFYIGNDESGDPIVVKTDSLGNQQWIKNLGGEYTDHITRLSNTNDGNFIAAYSYADSIFSPYISYSRIGLTKLDNQGNILWERKYGSQRFYLFVNSIKELENGDFIIVGSVYTYQPRRSGWVLRTDQYGDSLWYREYTILNADESQNRLFDIVSTSNNGFAACGYVKPVLPDTGDTDTWIIKLDSLGCDTPGCDTTVAIPEIAYKNTEDELYIYPNPASNILNIEYPIMNYECKSILEIFDIFGRKVKEIKVPKGQNEIIVDVSKWHRGMYFVILRQDRKMFTKEKFMIIR